MVIFYQQGREELPAMEAEMQRVQEIMDLNVVEVTPNPIKPPITLTGANSVVKLAQKTKSNQLYCTHIFNCLFVQCFVTIAL
jgi:hypothetical protein